MKTKGHHKGKMFEKGFTPWNKGILLDISCQKCTKVFQVQPYRKDAKFCSIGCARKGALRVKKGSVKNCELCKSEFYVPKAHLWKRYCSMKCSGIMARGRKPGNFIEDRTKLKISDRKADDTRYFDWRKNVKNRDGWKCKISNSDCSGRLEAHHILPWRSHPELRYEINNGITLCHHHHPRSRKMEMELSPYFQELLTM